MLLKQKFTGENVLPVQNQRMLANLICYLTIQMVIWWVVKNLDSIT